MSHTAIALDQISDLVNLFQCAKFFVQAHFGEDAGRIWALFWRNCGRCMGKFKLLFFFIDFCDLVHVLGVVDPFAEQLVVPAQNRQNAGGITDVRALYGQFFSNARINRRTGINTGDLGTLLFYPCLLGLD